MKATITAAKTWEATITAMRKAKLILGTLLVMVCLNSARAQGMAKPVWAIQGGGKMTEFASHCTADAKGNCYIAGQFASDGILGAYQVTAPTNTARSFLAKVDKTGTVIWFKRLGGGELTMVRGMCTDGAGNTFVTGQFGRALEFGGHKLKPRTRGMLNLYVAKFDAQGNDLWSAEAGGTTDDDVAGSGCIQFDGEGGCFVAGNFVGRLISGVRTLPAPENRVCSLHSMIPEESRSG